MGLPVMGRPQSENKNKQITLKEVNAVFKSAETNLKTLSKDVSTDKKDEWSRAISRKSKRKNNRPALVAGNSQNSTTVQGMEKQKAFHVSRLHPDTKVEDLKNFLNKKFINSTCEKLESKYPE